jgi:hypothetical protein
MLPFVSKPVFWWLAVAHGALGERRERLIDDCRFGQFTTEQISVEQ